VCEVGVWVWGASRWRKYICSNVTARLDFTIPIPHHAPSHTLLPFASHLTHRTSTPHTSTPPHHHTPQWSGTRNRSSSSTWSRSPCPCHPLGTEPGHIPGGCGTTSVGHCAPHMSELLPYWTVGWGRYYQMYVKLLKSRQVYTCIIHTYVPWQQPHCLVQKCEERRPGLVWRGSHWQGRNKVRHGWGQSGPACAVANKTEGGRKDKFQMCPAHSHDELKSISAYLTTGMIAPQPGCLLIWHGL